MTEYTFPMTVAYAVFPFRAPKMFEDYVVVEKISETEYKATFFHMDDYSDEPTTFTAATFEEIMAEI